MTLIETIQNNSSLERQDLQTVKNAHIFQDNGIVYCRHYDTIIFAYDRMNEQCEVRMNLSMTSNRQIKYLIIGLSVPNNIITDLEEGNNKWSFSGQLL